MDKNRDDLISAGFTYDEDLGGFYFSKENAQDWQSVSQAYAEQASGDVHVVLGDNVRESSVWNTKELPTLEKNEGVNKVISVDSSTGKEKDVLLDRNSTEPLLDKNEFPQNAFMGASSPNTQSSNRDLDPKADLGLQGISSTSNSASLGASHSGGIT